MTQQSAQVAAAPDVTVADVRFEHHREAFGIGTAQPRLSWTVATTADEWRQAVYEIAVDGGDERPRGRTGRVESDQPVLVPWPFAPLASRERVVVRVRVWGVDGRPSAWSAPHSVEAGLLHPGDWTARFVMRSG